MADTEPYDFAVIGGGSGGYAGARMAASMGLRTAVIDGAEELGGLCILRGCMPSKTLIESANMNLAIRHAGKFGLYAHVGAPDIKFIRDRKRRLIGEFASYRQEQLQDRRFDLVRGCAQIEKADAAGLQLHVTLRDGGATQLAARSVLIATGSVISVPDLPGLAECGFWTSDDVLDAENIPRSVIVLGGGAIALEMAHYLEGIGRQVTILQRNTQFLTGTDADVAMVVQRVFEKRGMAVHCGTKLLRVERNGPHKRVVFKQGGTDRIADGDEILVALGRRPASGGLGLEKIGVRTSKAGHIETAATQQSSVSRVFAAGDVCGPLEVVHLAIQQGEVAARNAAALLGGNQLSNHMDYRCKLFGVFTQPEVASVGLSEVEARAQGINFTVASYPFNDHGKSIVLNELDGFVKLLAHAESGIILGGAVVGPHATELIHEIAVAMHLKATAADLASAPHYHPTLSEIWCYPAEQLAELIKNN